MKSIINSFMSLSIGLKILIIFTLIVVISGTGVAIHMIINSGESVVTVAQAEQQKSKIPEDIIENIPEETIQIAQEPVKDEEKEAEEEKKEEKKVKYKDKEITIPKAKVASVNEKEDSQSQKSGGEQVSATDAVDKFENDGQSVGIDVSKHQGKINWAEVKNSGIEFAIIRCGFRGQTAGQIYEDAYFKTNVNGAVSNGIKVGIYFYSCAINEEEALQEAAWVVNAIKTYRITYPVVYDFEDFGKYRCVGVTGEQATSNAIAFLEYVKNAGYTPMMYASKNDITNKFNKSRLSGYKFWLAHYTSATNYTGSYQMWQYTSNGTVAGITGRVDMNVAYFRYGAVAEPKHTHDFENGEVIKTADSKEATCILDGVKYIRCASCSENKKVVLQKLGHKYGEWEIEKETGIEYRVCSVCKEKEEKPKIENEKGNTITNEAGNIISNTIGNTVGNTISNTVGNTIGNTIGNTTGGHTHNYVTKNTATCTDKGKTWKECSECGNKEEEKESDPLGHSYDEIPVEKEGKFYQICSTCGDEKEVNPSSP